MNWFKKLFGKGPELKVTDHGEVYPVLREGLEVWIANGQEEQKFTLGRFKRMKDGKGVTIFAGKHSVRKPKEVPPTPEPPTPEEPKGDFPI